MSMISFDVIIIFKSSSSHSRFGFTSQIPYIFNAQSFYFYKICLVSTFRKFPFEDLQIKKKKNVIYNEVGK